MKKIIFLFINTARVSIIVAICSGQLLITPAFAAQKGKTPAKKTPAKTQAKPPAKSTGKPAQKPLTPPAAKKTEPRQTDTPAKSTTTVDVTAPDSLDQIRALPSAQDRINALEKFIVTQRGQVVQE